MPSNARSTSITVRSSRNVLSFLLMLSTCLCSMAGCSKQDSHATTYCNDCGGPATSPATSLTFVGGKAFVAGWLYTGGVNTASRWIVRAGDFFQPWQISDSVEVLNLDRIEPRDIASDSSGRIYVVGEISTGFASSRWLVRRSLDSGATWQVVDDFQLSAGAPAGASAVSIDPSSGAVFVSGTAESPAGSSRRSWVTRKSMDAGSSWTTVDSYQYPSAFDSVPLATRVDGSGRLLAVGEVSFGENELFRPMSKWLVRRLNLDGTWTQLDLFELEAQATNHPSSIALGAGGQMLVSGFAEKRVVVGSATKSVSEWVTRKSADGGATWATVDDFKLASGAQSFSSSVVIDSHGTCFVAGMAASTADTIDKPLIRTSVDAGATWTNLQPAPPAIQYDVFYEIPMPGLLAVAPDGSLTLAYQDIQTTGKRTWTVVRLISGGTAWSIVDRFEAQ